MVDVPVFVVAPEIIVWQKKNTIYQLLEIEQLNFISYQNNELNLLAV